MESNLDHTDWEKSSPGEVRRRIGGRFLGEEESKASWGIGVSNTEENRLFFCGFEVVEEMEEMDEVGEGGRGMS